MNPHQQADLAARLFADTSRYQDLYGKSRPQTHHWPPTAKERAGQFAPFAALSGYHQLINAVAKRYAHKDYPDAATEQRLTLQLHHLARHLPRAITGDFFNGASGYYEPLAGQLTIVDWQRQEVLVKEADRTLRIPIANLRKLNPS